jgi:hypothetical protein
MVLDAPWPRRSAENGTVRPQSEHHDSGCRWQLPEYPSRSWYSACTRPARSGLLETHGHGSGGKERAVSDFAHCCRAAGRVRRLRGGRGTEPGPGGCVRGRHLRCASGDAVVIRHLPRSSVYTFADGRRGLVTGEGSAVACRASAVRVHQGHGTRAEWPRIRFEQSTTRFERDGVGLFGRLIEPPDATGNTPLACSRTAPRTHPGRAATARSPGRRSWACSRRRVYRCSSSTSAAPRVGGRFTMDLHLLAGDLAAAARGAQRLAAGRYGRFGLVGFSQGGWAAAPLAAATVGWTF